ncbi:MAG TPA: glycerol-3-phosphate dehydrogenase [Candidatus Limiplasma sp.]|nr:glycerol-3-phosphate dehydrogenase [Candidatus Limiplasma sp.]
MSIITIVGAGMMGSAMSFPASSNKHEVRLVGTPLDREIIERAKADGYHITLKRALPKGIRFFQFEELQQALADADLLISGVSSFGVQWFLDNVLQIIPAELPVLSVTKGMIVNEDGTLTTYPHWYEQQLKGKKLCINAVGGPCTSYELADFDPTEVCFCGESIGVLRELKALLNTEYYHISLSTDITGVECSVAMKNAYALGVTLAIGLSEKLEGQKGKEHYNSQAALFGQSAREMRKLLRIAGGNDESIIYGIGDLYVTVFGGRTRLIGTLLGNGLSFTDAMAQLSGITLESIVIATRTAQAVQRMAARGLISEADFPLLMHIDQVINHNMPVQIPWDQFEVEENPA